MDRNDNDVQKLKTGISGLDNLFYSGIQLSQYAELDKVDKKAKMQDKEMPHKAMITETAKRTTALSSLSGE